MLQAVSGLASEYTSLVQMQISAEAAGFDVELKHTNFPHASVRVLPGALSASSVSSLKHRLEIAILSCRYPNGKSAVDSSL